MPDSPTPPDCTGSPECFDAVNQCEVANDAAQQQCDDDKNRAEAACQHKPPAERAQCIQEAEVAFDQCGQVNEINKAFCFSEAARKFLNSSRNSGKKKRPGSNGCAPCTLPDCSLFVADCKATLGTLSAIITTQRGTGKPDPDTTLTVLQTVIDSKA